MMTLSKIVTIDDLRAAASRRLPKIAFDFIEGGVEGERCLARNEEAFSRYRLLPRYFVNVSGRSQSRTLFGKTYDSPFGICPTGIAGLWRTGADYMLAEAAAAANIPFALSASSNGSIEGCVARAPKNMWFQLYSLRDKEIGDRLVQRVADLGVETLVITADVPVAPKRERNLRNGFTRPLKLKLSTIIDGLAHPSWLAEYLRAGGGTPMMENWKPYTRPGASPDEVADVIASQTPASWQTWDDLERYRRLWKGNLVVKGILHPGDALRAVSLGVDGIMVSNHGGRQLDLAPSPIEVLPAIRAAVGPNTALIVDSGVRRGSDILVALCLGADFVFFGRPTLYGVAAYGLPGAKKALDILRTELDLNLGQIGSDSLDGLGPHFLFEPGKPIPTLRSTIA